MCNSCLETMNTECYKSNCCGISCCIEYCINLFFNSLQNSHLLLRYADLHASMKSEAELIPQLEEESSEGTCMVRKVPLSVIYSKPVTVALSNIICNGVPFTAMLSVLNSSIQVTKA